MIVCLILLDADPLAVIHHLSALASDVDVEDLVPALGLMRVRGYTITKAREDTLHNVSNNKVRRATSVRFSLLSVRLSTSWTNHRFLIAFIAMSSSSAYPTPAREENGNIKNSTIVESHDDGVDEYDGSTRKRIEMS